MSGTLKKLTLSQQAEIRQLLREGELSENAIARMYGINHGTIRAYRPREQAQSRKPQHRASKKYQRTDQEALVALRKLPPDNRDYTAQFFGDPLPTRSALYQKRNTP